MEIERRRIESRRQCLDRLTTYLLAAFGGATGSMGVYWANQKDPEGVVLAETYRATGKITDFDSVLTCFVARECEALDLKDDQKAYHRNQIRGFLHRAQAAFLQRMALGGVQPPEGLPKSGTRPSIIDLTNTLKLAFEQQYKPNTNYNSEYDSIVHVPHGRFQCRSGTYLFLLALKSNLESSLKDGERFVVVYSATEPDKVGHIVPGVVTAKGDIVTFEMTELGSTGRYLGSITAPPRNIRIRPADAALAEAALGFFDTTSIVDTVVDHEPQRSPATERFTDSFSFGINSATPGDKPLTTIDPEAANAQEQYVRNVCALRELAEKDQYAKEYLQILPQMMEFRSRLLLIENVSARLDSLSENQLKKLLSEVNALSREVSRCYDSNRDLAGLYVAAKLGEPAAAKELEQRIRNQRESNNHDGTRNTGEYVVEYSDLNLPSKRAKVDPVFAAANEVWRKQNQINDCLFERRRER